MYRSQLLRFFYSPLPMAQQINAFLFMKRQGASNKSLYRGEGRLEYQDERLFSRGRDLLGLRRFALQPGTMRMLTILKAFYSDDLFCKPLVDLEDEDIEDDVEVVIQRPIMSKTS